MLQKLTKGLNEDELDSFKYEYDKSIKFRQRLVEVLEKDLESVYTSMRNEENFDSSWPYKQAELVAQSRVYKKMISMLK